jgi:hypothetical protein
MKIELADDGYEKIDVRIQEIENLAYEGVFSDKNTVSRFQQIASETKKLRQMLREVLLLVPDATAVSSDKGDAA